MRGALWPKKIQMLVEMKSAEAKTAKATGCSLNEAKRS
jgi:hypothetical protein